jgi:hypothetical protein
MAHFAEIDENNVVKRVIVVHNNELLDNGVESESKGITFCESLFGGKWVQTSYNKNFRYNYAGKGHLYDEIRDAFIPPKPFDSWVLDEATCRWETPTPMPTDGKFYTWNEATISWVEIKI